jgi:hypothetical protein
MTQQLKGYSKRPMSRMQYLMLVALEGGATLDDAIEAALAWGTAHPRGRLFEERSYTSWRRAQRVAAT